MRKRRYRWNAIFRGLIFMTIAAQFARSLFVNARIFDVSVQSISTSPSGDVQYWLGDKEQSKFNEPVFASLTDMRAHYRTHGGTQSRGGVLPHRLTEEVDVSKVDMSAVMMKKLSIQVRSC